MTANRQPPAEHPRWEAFKSNFTQSNYITDFWNWFMTLMSKAAEMVLFGTVLYSGYQLLPGVAHVPAPIDAAVFVVQQGALDIGGMGLLKLAKRADLPKDSFPVRLGISLVVLMILNVALASIKHTLPMLPDGVFVGVETLLLIARAVVAVLFGHAIHALREEYGESTITVKEAQELQQAIEGLVSELVRVQQDCQRHIEQQVHLLTARQLTALATVRQELETTLANRLSPQRLMGSLTPHLETLVHERLTVSLAEMRRSATPVVSPETPETVSGSREARPLRLLTPCTGSHREASPEHETSGNATHQARIYGLLDEDRHRKPAELQRLTGIPKATVYRLVERYHREHPSSEPSTSNEAETTGDETVRQQTETAS